MKVDIMSQVIKVFLFLVFFVFSSLSLANPIEERNKLLCYLKNKHIHNQVYNYNSRDFFFYPSRKQERSQKKIYFLFLFRTDLLLRSNWELKGIQTNLTPFSSVGSVTLWAKYKDRKKKNLDQLCKPINEECIFKLVYKGYGIKPFTDTKILNSVFFTYKDRIKVAVYDSKNNILKFPAECPK